MRSRVMKAALVVMAGMLALGLVALSGPTPPPAPSPAPRTAGASELTLIVDGLVQSPLSLTLEDIVGMPASTVYAQLFCVGLPTTPLAEGNWTGVRLGHILEEAGVSPEAVKVAFYASDNFTTDLTVTSAMRHDILLAYERDGEPLTDNLRLVVPCKWGYKWIRDLIHIELVDYDFLGRYESVGYSDEANISGDTDGDSVGDPCDNCPSTPNSVQENADGDQWGDACDNCSATATPWWVPPGDGDCDGFSTTDEGVIGTDPADACANTPDPNDEADDRWPPDWDDTQTVNLLDVVPFKPHFNATYPDPLYEVRYDLNTDNAINLLDMVPFKPFFNVSCTP
jgi:hypothetical protein